jgi:cysteine desulfurase/selenocysteine lyase
MLDGAQYAPHAPIDVRRLDVDFYAFSGHKTYGPTGIGVLWGRRELLASMPAFMTGGQMIDDVTLTGASFRPPPRRFEAGTPPIAPAVGLGAALDFIQALDWRGVQSHERRLTRRLLDGLTAMAGVRVLGPTDTRDRHGVITFAVESFPAEEVCRHLDGHGVALRGGYHCAQPLVRAFGVDGAARASIAFYNSDSDIETLLEGLDELVHKRSARLPRRRQAGTRASA